MANLPANNDMTGSAVTQGGFKARLNDVLDYLRDILGSTGTPAAARTALGLGAMATKADVAEADIATGAVTADKIGANAVTSAKIAAGAVGNTKLADGAVGTAKIIDRAVQGGKIALATIVEENLANAAVGTAKVADAAITGAKLATAAVGTAALADGAVTAAKLAAGGLSVQVLAEANITSGVGQVDLALPSGPAMFLLLVGDLRPSTGAALRLRTSSDGVTFQSGGSDYTDVDGAAAAAGSFVPLSGLIAANEVAAPLMQFAIFPGAPTNPRFSIAGIVGTLDATGGAAGVGLRMGGRAAAGRQQAIRLYLSSGNINRATIRLIGVT